MRIKTEDAKTDSMNEIVKASFYVDACAVYV